MSMWMAHSSRSLTSTKCVLIVRFTMMVKKVLCAFPHAIQGRIGDVLAIAVYYVIAVC